MKVLHLSTWKEVCGIAGYTENLVESLDKQGFENEVYPINKEELNYFTLDEIRQHFRKFCELAKEFDLIHIQHEHSFFHGSYPFDKAIDIFSEILGQLKKENKKVIVTFHTHPIFYYPLYKLLVQNIKRPKTILSSGIQTIKWKIQIAPYFQSSPTSFKAIVHSKRSRLVFIDSGFAPEAIKIMKIAVNPRKKPGNNILSNEECKTKINLREDTRLLSIFGFVSEYKGYQVAIQALEYLPEEYHLAIIGGSHPSNMGEKSIENILALVSDLELEDRVMVTGFVELEVLDLFHGATDICLAPYLLYDLSGSAALTWALNSGKPIIASKIPAFYELNQKTNCMSMVMPNSPRELAWKILQLDKDEALKQELVDRALAYSREHSWDKIASITYKVYQELTMGDRSYDKFSSVD
jgi:glycosyltransferase involved in cell wall biosynthesis